MGGDNKHLSDNAQYEQRVDMTFNAKQFGRQVKDAIEVINMLKESLDFSNSAESFDEVSRSISSLNVSNARLSINGLDDSFKSFFSTLKNFHLVKKAEEAISSLEQSFLKTAKAMAGFDNAKAGWEKYATKTRSVQTIMAATGKSVDEVSSALKRLNWYTDETSFNFSDMVQTIGKFTSAGVSLEDSVSAMEGVANWAATSGQDIQQASRAMYNLSQALAIGSVKMQDWRSIQQANMATSEFKETVLETGVAIGKLKKVGNEYVTTTGKKIKVTAKTFESTLSNGWFDSELLVASLKKYSEFTDKVYDFIETYHKEHPEEDILTVDQAIKKMGKDVDSLGLKWLSSAQEAKTFKDVLDSVKDASSTAWSDIYEDIFGNYEQSRHFWTDLANELYEVIVTPLQNLESFAYDTMSSNYERLK